MPKLELAADRSATRRSPRPRAVLRQAPVGPTIDRLLLVPPERGRQRRPRSTRDRLGRQAADAALAGDLERRLLQERVLLGRSRAATLEDDVKAAWGGPNMNAGKDNLDKKAAEIAKVAGYKKLIADAFGAEPIKAIRSRARSPSTCARSSATTPRTTSSPPATRPRSTRQQRGLDVFMGRGKHASCHTPPFLRGDECRGRRLLLPQIGTQVVPRTRVAEVTARKQARGLGCRQPLSLQRDQGPPYFHDGSVASSTTPWKIKDDRDPQQEPHADHGGPEADHRGGRRPEGVLAHSSADRWSLRRRCRSLAASPSGVLHRLARAPRRGQPADQRARGRTQYGL